MSEEDKEAYSDEEAYSDANHDISSETEEELTIETDEDEGTALPISWKKAGAKWEVPQDANIEKRILELIPEFAAKLSANSEPYEILSTLYARNEYWQMIHQQTSLYNTWRSLQSGKKKRRKVLSPTIEELKVFHGIVIYMGIVQLPNRRMYWQAKTRVDQIANKMAFNRFSEIASLIHFNDNNIIPNRNSPDYNQCYKIQPLIDHFRKCFSEVVQKETFLSIDEQVVPFKGKSGLKRYLKNKPKKWGYKLWALAGISGYVYDFEVDGMKGSHGPPPFSNPPAAVGESGYVVLRLSKSLEPNRHKIFFDNFFNSPELLQYLGRKHIWAIGTLNKKRSRKCPIKSETNMKKEGRGFSYEIVSSDGKIVVVPWYDNKTVLTTSNYQGTSPKTKCKRWDKKKKESISIDRPASVTVYNKFMGGVDKSDMMLALYRTKYRTRKWYQRLAMHFFSQSCVNAWIVHCSLCPDNSSSYIDFILDIALCLLHGQHNLLHCPENPEPQLKKKRVSRCDVPMVIRYDKYDHWPILCDLKNCERCKMEGCNGKTKFKCSKCNLYLCVAKRDCFVAFHDPELRE